MTKQFFAKSNHFNFKPSFLLAIACCLLFAISCNKSELVGNEQEVKSVTLENESLLFKLILDDGMFELALEDYALNGDVTKSNALVQNYIDNTLITNFTEFKTLTKQGAFKLVRTALNTITEIFSVSELFDATSSEQYETAIENSNSMKDWMIEILNSEDHVTQEEIESMLSIVSNSNNEIEARCGCYSGCHWCCALSGYTRFNCFRWVCNSSPRCFF